VDRAALDWAIEHGLRRLVSGRRAEDGRIGSQYLLKETPLNQYVQRSEWNVRDSDATLLVTLDNRMSAGRGKRSSLPAATRSHACMLRAPCQWSVRSLLFAPSYAITGSRA
jgi:hypothetical protein